MEILSRLALYEIGRQYVLARARRIDPAKVDVEGSDINLFIGSQSFVAAAVSRQLADRMAAQFLDGCESDDDLDRWAFDRFGGELPRKGASPALVPVVFTRRSNAAGAGSITAGTKLTTIGGIEYFTLQTAALTANGSASDLIATVEARSAQAGKDQQVGANAIRRFARPDLLFDPTIEVNNPEPAAGGEDAETRDVFRERLRAGHLARRRGILAAIETGARAVPGVESALAIEEVEQDATPARVVRLLIADSSGVASRVLAERVRVKLLEYRCGGIAVVIDLSVPQMVDLVVRPTFLAGIDAPALRERVRAALVSFVNSLGAGQPLLRNDVGAVFARFRAEGLVPVDGTLEQPIGDIVPAAGRTLRTTLERVVFV